VISGIEYQIFLFVSERLRPRPRGQQIAFGREGMGGYGRGEGRGGNE
jgi:hypothetical protein